MDRDNEVRPWVPGSRPAQPPARRGLFLQRLREDYNAAALEHLPQPPRQRRIIAYALTGPTGTADQGLALVRALIEREGHAVAYELTDSAQQPIWVNGRRSQAPQLRPNWVDARRLVYCGFADGIAVVDRFAVSQNDDEYEEEIHWIGQRPGLLLIAGPEAAT
ncbi:hypothetical protein AB0I66_42380 [Streptomyces sp. NPDC050439]|uniref:hypothetical protein n=1 Tax=unclassified Streptomyces TaxID=2593676 RepID=UPI00341F898A